MGDPVNDNDPRIPGAVLDIDELPERLREAMDPAREAARLLAGRIPARYADAVASLPEVRAWVTSLVEPVMATRAHALRITTGRSLLLAGPVGSGKTYESYGAIRALAHSGVGFSWQFVTSADLYAKLRPRPRIDAEEEFGKYANCTVLILDDLGAAKATEWTEEVNYRLVNHRYENALPTLITSNVAPNKLVAELGDRVASRLVEMADRVVLTTPDRRRAGKGASA